MSTITAILVDDEISNLKGLRKKVETLFPKIEIYPWDQICASG